MKRQILGSLLLCISFLLQAQITTDPSKPKTTEEIEIVFDAGKGNKALFGLQEEVFFHAGLITNTSTDEKDWKFVQGNWGKADPDFQMESLGGDKYQLLINPQAFFHIDTTVKVQQIAIVFRDAKGEKVAKNIDETDFLIPVNGYKPPQKIQDEFKYSSRKFIGYQLNKQQLMVNTNHGNYRFQFYAPDILKVNFLPENTIIHDTSISVVLYPENVDAELKETTNKLVWESPQMKCIVQKDPFEVSFFYKSDLLIKEELGFFERKYSSGIRFELSPKEAIYGTGERAIPLNRRGYKLELYNRPDYNYAKNARNLNYTLPVLLSDRKYLLFIDNPQKAQLDIGETEEDILEFSAIGGEMKYYIVAGESYNQVSSSFTKLVGRQPLPPRWALGNLQSRMAYRTQKEVEDIVGEMIEKDFPIDAVIIDFYWFGDSIKGYLGNLKWYEKNWPQPKKMIEDFKKKGVKTILITEPFVIDTSYWFEHADSSSYFATHKDGSTYVMNDFYFGKAALIDLFKSDSKEWFWQQYQKQIEIGVAGWWGDLGEPETHPVDMYHINGKAQEVHNMYANEWAKMVFENYQKHYPNQRLFHLNRSGATGTQRYSIFPWSGDVSRSWSGLQAQLPLMLNMSLCGLAYISSDLGGFALGEKDEELYIRWLQMGVFNPIFRPHGSGIPSEPIFFSEQTQNIVRRAIKLRYSLMPYIYNASYNNTISGQPIVKPLFYYHSKEEAFKNYSEMYYFGDQIIVAPVIEKGQKEKNILLPKGKWFDFYNDEYFEGGKEYTLNTTLWRIPVFVKAGSFIPMLPLYSSTDFYPEDKIFMQYFHHPSIDTSVYQLFEDDGENARNLETNNYQLIHFKAVNNQNEISIFVHRDRKEYKKNQEEREIWWCFHNIEFFPKGLVVNGEKIKIDPILEKPAKPGIDAKYDDKRKVLYLDMPWIGDEMEIKIINTKQ